MTDQEYELLAEEVADIRTTQYSHEDRIIQLEQERRAIVDDTADELLKLFYQQVGKVTFRVILYLAGTGGVLLAGYLAATGQVKIP